MSTQPIALLSTVTFRHDDGIELTGSVRGRVINSHAPESYDVMVHGTGETAGYHLYEVKRPAILAVLREPDEHVVSSLRRIER